MMSLVVYKSCVMDIVKETDPIESITITVSTDKDKRFYISAIRVYTYRHDYVIELKGIWGFGEFLSMSENIEALVPFMYKSDRASTLLNNNTDPLTITFSFTSNEKTHVKLNVKGTPRYSLLLSEGRRTVMEKAIFKALLMLQAYRATQMSMR